MATTIVPSGDAAALVSAVSSAVAGDTVLLEDGTYYPSAAVNTGNKHIYIESRSGDPTKCIVDGSGSHRCFYVHDIGSYNPPDNPETVVTNITGITLRNGYISRNSTGRGGGGSVGGYFVNCIFDTCQSRGNDAHGGALYQPDGCVNCIFRNCSSNCHGGAVQVEPAQSWKTSFINCLFDGCYILRSNYAGMASRFGKFYNCTWVNCENSDISTNRGVSYCTVAHNCLAINNGIQAIIGESWNATAPTNSDLSYNAFEVVNTNKPYDPNTTITPLSSDIDAAYRPVAGSQLVGYGSASFLQTTSDLSGIAWRNPPSVGCYELILKRHPFIPTRMFPLGV